MTWRCRYDTVRARLLSDPSVCEANRLLFADFFAFQEYKLKRQNGLQDLDEGCCKTLYGYTQKFWNVNRWFQNKPWKDLTREDIKHVYDGLEDGRIRNRAGKPFEDRVGYYNKVFKSKPFRLAGKTELAREVIEFAAPVHRAVRYITEESFRRLVAPVSNPVHAFLLWLAWDIGENINTLLKLAKHDFIPQTNSYTGEREYLVNLSPEKLKRSRKARSEPTLYKETAQYADLILARLGPQDPVFPIGYRSAVKALHAAIARSGATTMPDDQRVRWKDLRSGMACHLLRSGWTTDEVNARLGHTPRSQALDAYINFLALDRSKSKERMRGLAAESRTTPAAAAESPPPPPPLQYVASSASSGTATAGREEGIQALAELIRRLLAPPSVR